MIVLFNIFWASIVMQELFSNVFDNYYSTRIKLQGKANVIGTPDQEALLRSIPKKIEAYLKLRGIAHLFKVEGSIGNGNIARVPWVGIFRRDITENAQNGYYIVLLFSEDMGSCYLSLNQGITAIENLYTKSFALKKMREGAQGALRFLECDPEAWLGPIVLRSTRDLGRAYEAAAIVSYRYARTDPPSEALFFQHLDHLLFHYDKLHQRFGKNLYSLFTVSEGEFQQVVMEKAAQPGALQRVSPDRAMQSDVTGALSLAIKGYARSPIVAAEAIRAANFMCEIDPSHWTFTSKAKKQRYVEAHHLIPISLQERFETSLDVVANVVSLCATCHRMLHFGVEQDRKTLLVHLLKQRQHRLLESAITVRPNEFLKFYGSGVVLED